MVNGSQSTIYIILCHRADTVVTAYDYTELSSFHFIAYGISCEGKKGKNEKENWKEKLA